jgi:hypothetical protein
MKLFLSRPSLTGRQLLVNIYAAKVKPNNIRSIFPFPINLRITVFDGSPSDCDRSFHKLPCLAISFLLTSYMKIGRITVLYSFQEIFSHLQNSDHLHMHYIVGAFANHGKKSQLRNLHPGLSGGAKGISK